MKRVVNKRIACLSKNKAANGKNSNGYQVNVASKDQDLATVTVQDDQRLTTKQGQPISDDQNSLRAGQRGPTLLEDYILREKIQHFDHERSPERVVHARGAGAHGYFQVYESMAQYTTAKVLQDPAVQTPVFVRFSTVAGSRGSADTARDVRGFAVKMYTAEGTWDIVGNNMPVFFIQDGMYVPGGAKSIEALRKMGDARRFVDEAFKHGKAIGAVGEGVELVMAAELGQLVGQQGAPDLGVLLGKTNDKSMAKQFVDALAQHRFRNREQIEMLAA